VGLDAECSVEADPTGIQMLLHLRKSHDA